MQQNSHITTSADLGDANSLFSKQAVKERKLFQIYRLNCLVQYFTISTTARTLNVARWHRTRSQEFRERFLSSSEVKPAFGTFTQLKKPSQTKCIRYVILTKNPLRTEYPDDSDVLNTIFMPLFGFYYMQEARLHMAFVILISNVKCQP